MNCRRLYRFRGHPNSRYNKWNILFLVFPKKSSQKTVGFSMVGVFLLYFLLSVYQFSITKLLSKKLGKCTAKMVSLFSIFSFYWIRPGDHKETKKFPLLIFANNIQSAIKNHPRCRRSVQDFWWKSGLDRKKKLFFFLHTYGGTSNSNCKFYVGIEWNCDKHDVVLLKTNSLFV